MALKVKDKEILNLFDRVYNDKMIIDEKTGINDSEDIKQYCKMVFGDGETIPSVSAVHQFNNLVVRKADEVAKPMVTDIVGLLANTQSEKRGNVIEYELPTKRKARFVWSANGVGVDLIRVAGKTKEVAVPRTFNTGFYYEPEDLVQDSVQAFRDLVNNLAEAKVNLYLREINKLIVAAKNAQQIPQSNIKEVSNITLKDYNELASTLGRYGGRPLFIADTLLIDHIAMQQAQSGSDYANLLTDKYKTELLHSLNITKIGRTDAMNLVNPFLDDKHTATELPVNIGYMLAGEGKLKPFRIVEYGGLRQTTEIEFETGRVRMMVFQDAAVVLVFPSTLGYVKDDSITLA